MLCSCSLIWTALVDYGEELQGDSVQWLQLSPVNWVIFQIQPLADFSSCTAFVSFSMIRIINTDVFNEMW